MKARNIPTRYDIEAYRGDTLSLPFQARNSSGVVDLTSHIVAAQVRQTRLGTVIVASFTTFVEDAAQGLYTIVLDPTAWASITCGETAKDAASKYVWDTQITTPAGEVKTTHEGAFIVLADVTRSASPGGDGGNPSSIPSDVIDGGGV
jgi:hypothetical protein